MAPENNFANPKTNITDIAIFPLNTVATDTFINLLNLPKTLRYEYI
jgi:hypothetical protein